jgi:hypothetical protein
MIHGERGWTFKRCRLNKGFSRYVAMPTMMKRIIN